MSLPTPGGRFVRFTPDPSPCRFSVQLHEQLGSETEGDTPVRAFAVDAFGEAGSVHELPDPTPGEGQVRVRVDAASVNPVDIPMMKGLFKDMMEHRLPLVPGQDLGGEVDAVGPGVDGWRLGDPVFGVHGKMVVGEGTFAQYIIASSATIARRPGTMDAGFGAAASLAGVSALQMVEAAQLQPGDVVLVIGAAGGIGSFVLQLAAAAGARPIAVTRSVNHDYVRSLGAVEAIDYSSQDVLETVRTAHPDGLTAIFDMVGNKEEIDRPAQLLRRGGHLLSMVGAADTEVLASRGITGVNVVTQATTDKLERLAGFVEAGKLKPPEIRTFRLEEAGQALAEIEGRHVRGKLVVVP
jgi:NADPH:quinone reductase-like Zn-dependent oxidoreductase